MKLDNMAIKIAPKSVRFSMIELCFEFWQLFLGSYSTFKYLFCRVNKELKVFLIRLHMVFWQCQTYVSYLLIL
jgi:hypothetical protein